MAVKIFNGKLHSKNIIFNILEITKMIVLLRYNIPNLSIILLGNDFASNLYVKNKIRMCIKLNFFIFIFKLSKSIKNKNVINLINVLNEDNIIKNILLQLPLPKTLNTNIIIKTLNIYKDVDSLHPYTIGKNITYSYEYIKSCTPAAVIYFLKSLNIDFKGLVAILIGFSNIVGKPLIFELFILGLTIFILHKNNNKFLNYISIADIIIIAVGKINFISDVTFKFNSIIIDIGINKLKNDITGDIDYKKFSKYINCITPVPGGIGPITITRLMKNILILSILDRH